ncbi:MAG: aldo/keto reductase [Candidatus Diapherotrites archaeon]|uniref:Aldo/keto reductase n=1 Tax=Candidatus Iainarchaeum sp. TaxID=3101447 RepID=A0A938YTN9_9ARCH|nr:aldo/keto reductase [Candidatus Diapherotrites archaeon]
MPAKIPSVRLPGNVQIPALGLGTWLLNGEKCASAVKASLELGYTHIDTAEMYNNQVEIGNAIEGFDRKRLFLVSKAWSNHMHFNDLINACEKTLGELGTDYLDLYLIHWPNPKVPIAETLKAMQQLKNEGKIRAFGLSNFTIPEIEQALQTSKEIATNQVEMHPLFRQGKLLEYCNSKNIPITAYSPIARGKVFQNKTILKIAERHGKSPAQISLKWLLQKGTIVIPKASSKEHLEQNLGIFSWKLTAEEIQEIDSIREEVRLVNPGKYVRRIAGFFLT